jgi:four helix bundle protein
VDHEHDVERPPTFEDGQDIRDRAFTFACRVVTFCQAVYDRGGVGRMMVPQVVNCATSFATMLEEAKAAESTPDFISKCSISLKESRESWTRLRVYHACRIGPEVEARDLVREASELIAIMTAIVRNTRRNAAKKKEERSKRRRRSSRKTSEL